MAFEKILNILRGGWNRSTPAEKTPAPQSETGEKKLKNCIVMADTLFNAGNGYGIGSFSIQAQSEEEALPYLKSTKVFWYQFHDANGNPAPKKYVDCGHGEAKETGNMYAVLPVADGGQVNFKLEQGDQIIDREGTVHFTMPEAVAAVKTHNTTKGQNRPQV